MPMSERNPPQIRPDKLETALAAGELWRAKEILSGRIGSTAFDPALYERYGALLLQMGDKVAAGKFLFLCGSRRPEYDEAIGLFLRKYSKTGWRDLLASFPASARREPWSRLPVNVRDELRTRGAPAVDHDTVAATIRRPEAMSTSGCLVLALAFLVVGLGVSMMLVWIDEWRSGQWRGWW
jgi:hypothetical protein